jgi:hypothetical protein
MIELGKKYKTMDGREVRIYAVDGNMPYVVHGAIKYDCGWATVFWTGDGVYDLDNTVPDFLDLIEVKPRIQRDVWINVYNEIRGGSVNAFRHREMADECACEGRIACVHLKIDVEEGEGL